MEKKSKQEQEHRARIERLKENVFSPQDVEDICKVFYLLSDPNRFKIVEALSHGALCVYHLAEVCEGTLSNVSHQLRVLRDNKIVKARRCGKNVEYSIADMHIQKIVEMGIEHLKC